MRIRVEPKDFFMYAVYVAFSQDQPEVEDEEIRAYLQQHDLVPKWQERDRWEDQDFEVMYFGGCYLGPHLNVIGNMQRTAVEKELLTAEVERILKEGTEASTRCGIEGISPPEVNELIAGLVKEFHLESSFSTDEDGHLRVMLEAAVVRNRMRELVSDKD